MLGGVDRGWLFTSAGESGIAAAFSFLSTGQPGEKEKPSQAGQECPVQAPRGWAGPSTLGPWLHPLCRAQLPSQEAEVQPRHWVGRRVGLDQPAGAGPPASFLQTPESVPPTKAGPSVASTCIPCICVQTDASLPPQPHPWPGPGNLHSQQAPVRLLEGSGPSGSVKGGCIDPRVPWAQP